MIAPGSTADWIMGATMLGTAIAFAATAHRWMPEEAELAERPVPWHELRELQIDERTARSPVAASR